MIAAFSVTPLGAGDSVGDLVAEAVRVVRDSGLPSETNAMFTNVEGEWDEVMHVVRGCVDAVLAAGAPRVSVVMKLDVRPGVEDALHRKVASVERRLEGPPWS
ncbi:MAG: MTH1187 family thiamine-binding protein [Acidimicrobiia bacterium]|nr:MTH1187 family thiamine-binding protein [Acidimicrobiia bacterium]